MRTLSQDFLWGGAVAGSSGRGAWNEDGKGMSVIDVLTAGRMVSIVKLQTE